MFDKATVVELKRSLQLCVLQAIGNSGKDTQLFSQGMCNLDMCECVFITKKVNPLLVTNNY